jgi:hypothetical protein
MEFSVLPHLDHLSISVIQASLDIVLRSFLSAASVIRRVVLILKEK